MLVDSHCHLNYKGITENIDAVIQNARNNHVNVMLNICTKRSELELIPQTAARFDNIYATVGIHPHEAEKDCLTTDELLAATKHLRVIGIGETGLDYFYEHSPRDLQKKSFLTHIEVARKTDFPLIIHSREADSDMAEILETEMKKGSFRFVLHCFTSSEMLANKALELGGYISLSGIITFKNSQYLRELAVKLPQDRILVETDAPFLAPVPHRGEVNQPAFVKHTAELLAELRGKTFADIAQITSDNFFRLFSAAK